MPTGFTLKIQVSQGCNKKREESDESVREGQEKRVKETGSFIRAAEENLGPFKNRIRWAVCQEAPAILNVEIFKINSSYWTSSN